MSAQVPDELLPDHDPAAAQDRAPTVADGQVPPGEVTAQDELAMDAGSPAARLRARLAQVSSRRHEFAVPPRDVWGDDLVMVAQPVEIERGMTLVSVVAEATVSILWRDNDGKMKPIEEVDVEPGRKARPGWIGVGEVAGIITPDTAARTSVGDVIAKVCGTEEVLGVFVQDVLAWNSGRRSEVAALLGE